MFEIVSETHFSLKPSEVQPNLKVNPFWDDFLAFWHLFEVIFIE